MLKATYNVIDVYKADTRMNVNDLLFYDPQLPLRVVSGRTVVNRNKILHRFFFLNFKIYFLRISDLRTCRFWLQQSCKPDRIVVWLIVTFEWKTCCTIACICIALLRHYWHANDYSLRWIIFYFDINTVHQSTDTCCLLAIRLCYSDYQYHIVTMSLNNCFLSMCFQLRYRWPAILSNVTRLAMLSVFDVRRFLALFCAFIYRKKLMFYINKIVA